MVKYLLLTFDLEEFVLPEEYGLAFSEKESFQISQDGLQRILALLKKYPIKCTFFSTYQFAVKSKKLIAALVKDVHELALHGYSHDKKPFRDATARNQLAKAKKGLETLFKVKVKGYRNPQLQDVDYSFLNSLGIKYDSSYHPTWLPGYYNHFFGSRRVVPISVASLLRLPFSWIFFRNMPLLYSQFTSTLANVNTDYLNIYIHPWEFADLAQYNVYKRLKRKGVIAGLSIAKTGKPLLKKLDQYIAWLLHHNYQGITIKDYLQKKKLL
jgi:peptidoglycan/xylan/chitin deacetylase (PgdA/CDA1 family)